MAVSSPSTQWASSLRNPSSAPQYQHQQQQGESSTAFRIPGPSTRFHKEHKPPIVHHEVRPRSTRFATDSPSTRCRISGSVSPSTTASPTPTSIPLPVRPDHARRKSTPQSYFMPHHAPLTPVRSQHRPSLTFADSPCSDYYTDENRSVDDQSSTRLSPCPPSSQSQKLLLRLNTLGAEILRQDPSGPQAITNIAAKLDDLEAALRTPRTSEHDTSRPQTPLSSSTEDLPPAVRTKIRNQERLISDAQDVLQVVSRANDGLRKRYLEIRHIHESTVQELEQCSRENSKLKSENESLKADLAFDHSELLFMKLQLKALEVEADAFCAHTTTDPDLVKKRLLLDEDIERWKSDWDDVDARLHSRRSRHSVVSTTPENLSAAARDSPPSESQGTWLLDTCERRQGRMNTITIKRLDPSSANGHDEEDDDTLADDGHKDSPIMYSAQATQTSEPFLTKSEWDDLVKSLDSADHISQDCPADESGSEDEDRGLETDSDDEPVRKTPWRELCDSLVSFAGMDRD